MAGIGVYLEPLGLSARLRLSRLIGEAKAADPLAPVTVVVPSPYAGLSLRRSLAADGGLLNVRFMVLPRLAEILGSPVLAENGESPLTSLVEIAAIRSVSAGLSGQGPIIEVSHPALHQALRGAFKDLDRLSGQELEKLADVDPLRRQIVQWYRLTRHRLQGYYNREELSRAAARAVTEGRAESALRDLGSLIFHLIRSPSPGEDRLLQALGKRAQCALVIGITSEPELDAPAHALAGRLEQTLGPAATTMPPAGEPVAEHLVSASDAQEEIRWVLRHLMKQAEAGLPFHQMAVLYRQSDPYASLVPSQLRLAGIPVAGPDYRRLKDTPPGKLLLGLLQVFEDEFSRESLMHWLSEAPVKTGGEPGAASAEVARWEIISRKAGVIKGLAQWQERVGRYSDSTQSKLNGLQAMDEVPESVLRELQAHVASAVRLVKFVEDLASLPPPPEASWGDYVRWGRQALERHTTGVEHWPAGHADTYARVEKRLRELSALDHVISSVDLGGFRQTLEEAMEAPAGRTGATGSGVFVAPLGIAQGMEFDTVYLVGMAEGAFPPAPPFDPLLPDQVREELSAAGVPPLQRARSIEERWQYLAALAAGKRRILCYARTDSTARRGQYPSVWFLQAVSRLYGQPVGSTGIARLGRQSWLSVIESPQQALEYASAITPADTHDHDVAAVAGWRQRGQALERHPLAARDLALSRAARLEYARQGPAFTEWDGSLVTMAGGSRKLGLPAAGTYSPTRLESWAKCPFSYFLSHVLGLSVLDKPEEVESISAMDRGSLIHKVLEKLFNACMKQERLPGYGRPWDSWHRQKLLEIAEAEFGDAEAKGITGKALLWEVAREEIRQDLMAFLDEDDKMRAETNLRPAWVERRFGFGGAGSLAAVELNFPDGPTLRFRGVIDRIDTDASGSRMLVTDYKSGSSYQYRDMNTKPLGYGRHLQLPIYALAAQSGSDSRVEITAQYWFITNRGRFERKPLSLADQEALFRNTVGTIVSGIQSGVFPANPGRQGRDGPENCAFCDFDRVCPTNRDLSWDRKLGDPALTAYSGLLAGQMAGGDEE